MGLLLFKEIGKAIRDFRKCKFYFIPDNIYLNCNYHTKDIDVESRYATYKEGGIFARISNPISFFYNDYYMFNAFDRQLDRKIVSVQIENNDGQKIFKKAWAYYPIKTNRTFAELEELQND